MKRLLFSLMTVSTLLAACGGKAGSVPASAAESIVADMPEFNADSAYRQVERQVGMGPRVPGTQGHRTCGAYLASELDRLGADTVIVQEAVVTAFNGDRLPIKNIMGRFNTGASSRILLLAHWDTRPWADAEDDTSLHSRPIPGANDGGSGVGVLLEVARKIGERKPETGVDILFVDAEDYGDTGGSETSWALGTQHWVTDMPYGPDDKPRYAVLLDMVGGRGARFHREPFSDRYARQVVNRVWSTAEASGYGDRFVNRTGTPVVDDHIFLLAAGIPAIDIIEAINEETGSFPPTWHTLADDMDSIDPASLKAVGQTILNMIYQTK